MENFNYAIEHITNNIDISNKLSILVCKQRRYKSNYNICMSDIKKFRYNMLYHDNIIKNVDMKLLQLYNRQKYNNITDSIINNRIPLNISFYNFNRGRYLSLFSNLYRISNDNIGLCNSSTLYFKFLLKLNNPPKKVLVNFTPCMYNKLQSYKKFNSIY